MIRKKLKIASESKSLLTASSNEVEHSNDDFTTSPFFGNDSSMFWHRLYSIECRLSARLKEINFLSATIAAVYNPIEYASELHCNYLKKFLNGPKDVLFIGMNPGPWGMIQTGVMSITFIRQHFA